MSAKLILNSIPSDGVDVKELDGVQKALFKLLLCIELHKLNKIMEELK